MSFAPIRADRLIFARVPKFNKVSGSRCGPPRSCGFTLRASRHNCHLLHGFVMGGLRGRYNQRAPSRPELIKTAANHSTRNARSGTAMRAGASMRCVDPSR